MVQQQVPYGADAAQGQRLSSLSPSTRPSTSLSRCRVRKPVSENAFSKPPSFHSQKIQKIAEIPSRRSWRFILKIMEVPQVGGFRRTWRFPSFSTQSRWPMTLLRVQTISQMLLVQFTEKLVEVTMVMRTSSGSPSITANSGDASDSGSGNSSECGEHSNGAADSARRLSRRHRCSSRR